MCRLFTIETAILEPIFDSDSW